ncbi:leucyl aminopeptidase [Paracoccus sp. (in: a-proteobacteria)]|uniref:leucyl aminopeptidase n=1 Tax=Paracoccus sp. TaxID=267 RepID=UPI0026DFB317|nr:leucyl aminopeptidase [Paracoccus sp. (in: a-proteobacteria)]MDO5648648.1 leucyl aminopeptidase [Paracoccus sp. (in: a-proteobacteria)]
MTQPVPLAFAETDAKELATHTGRVALIVDQDGKPCNKLPRPAQQAAERALASDAGRALKNGAVMELAFPAGMAADALMLVRLDSNATQSDARKAGAAIGAKLGKGHSLIWAGTHKRAGDVALGAMLRAYDFSIYQTQPVDGDVAGVAADIPQTVGKGGKKAALANADADTSATAPNAPIGKDARITMMVKDPAALRDATESAQAVAQGVFFTRDLVNEPANVLTTTNFADRLKDMESLGLKVEVLDEADLEKLGMRALLAVGQGSESPSKVVVMRWNGGKKGDAPLALVGKGVVFDTGGISIKPAAGMEEMTMDMGGAGVVAGVMRTLALRKARANVVGLVGLVENMPDGRAQRPGDIVRSMKGDTIEVINTDAEGRLVLADVLWYAQDRFNPSAVIDLATLTGAVIIALGHDNAGIMSNDDALAGQIIAAAGAEGEGAWRLPLGPSYDSLIKSRLADMKNTGGRAAGTITAAQFLQRFIKPGQAWAHIDIAGVALPPSGTDLAPKGASGWGVMTLDRLIRDQFETQPK